MPVFDGKDAAATGNIGTECNLPSHVRFGREICGDLTQAERREWWLANGLGGYAAGTIAGTLTRRYHGLLIAPVNPPLGRYLVFAKADAEVLDGERTWPLFTNRWGDGAVDPQGYVNIESFHLDGRMPVWRFALGDRTLEMRVWMEPGANTTYVAYRLGSCAGENDRNWQLRVKLLVNTRDHHGTARPWDFNPVIEADADRLRVTHPNRFTLHCRARGGVIQSAHYWVENFDLPVEHSRGLPDRDNHLCVGEALLRLRPGEWVGVVASLDGDASSYLEEAMRRFRAHDAGLLTQTRVVSPEFMDAPEWIEQLVLAADSFVFARPRADMPDGASIIAGYPWFGDWGRDTMIALPGVTLATGRYDQARRILETFAGFVDGGMLPNMFPEQGKEAAYNSVDAALWYIEAWRAYLHEIHDQAAMKRIFPVLAGILDAYQAGTRYGIVMDVDDGLLRCGEPGVQLTWMDAKIGDWVVTPRIGKPVEVNALWYNAICVVRDMADELEFPSDDYRCLSDKSRQSFQRFINNQSGALLDVVDGPQGDDTRLRPNQILAVSLPHSPLDREAQARVVEQCGRELLCTHGLRSLAPSDRDYRPDYRGGVMERDSAYHQGTAWTWLLGHYALAEYRVYNDAAAAQARLQPIRDHLRDAGLGTVSEIFDGAAPHAPRGAPAQAWSVACVLEAWWRLERIRQDAFKNNRCPARRT